jgi:hypothetical protein
MLGEFDTVEKLNDFGRAEHDGNGLWLFGGGDDGFDRPRLRKRDGVEKPERRHRDDHAAGCQLPIVREIHQILANLLRPQLGRRSAEVTRESRDVLRVSALRQRRQIPDLQILEHALPKRGHRRGL